MKPTKVRNQQKFRAMNQTISKEISAPISKELRKKYSRRNARILIGDAIKVIRGEYKGIAGKVSKINTVKVTEKFVIERYSHVMHIVSNVVGKFNKKFSKFDTLLSGFPAGTVSGAPKIRAMEIIDDLENTKRKVYAGGIGYFSANGDFDTCIALRTAVSKNNKFYVQAGAGIVADSKPINEYKETVNKAKALLKSLE